MAQNTAITSDPAGTWFLMSNGLSCTTPCTRRVKRRPRFTVTIEKAGYKAIVTHSDRRFTAQAGSFGNQWLFGGITQAGVDGSSSAIIELNPNPLHSGLEEQAC